MLVHQSKRLKSPCCLITNHDASLFPAMFIKGVGRLNILVTSIKYNMILKLYQYLHLPSINVFVKVPIIDTYFSSIAK